MPLTADQTTLRRLRQDIGDTQQRVFTDPVLADILADPANGGDYARAVETALWRMVTDAALLARFLEGERDPEARAAAHAALLANYRAWRDAHRPAGSVPRIAQGRHRYTTAEAL
jgi:hypothetical protein